ncbi:hypothetical protein AWC03_09800 [Mycobacterium europaeum]|uniref:hypothetical protein n=1 Tax=Mycobacterium europaeum TaxID=761804 RepID=UPI000A169537|nr:hypothetical protein [Mycobacterium europaeum]ORV61483.1 hypothetical protein AWC03_09800 [Mycobacterium europaeum]
MTNDTTGDDWDLIAHSVSLGDVGLTDYLAATAVSADGSAYLLLARRDRLGDDTARYDADCSDIEHEQTGPLPLEYVRRITISRRRQRTEGADQ